MRAEELPSTLAFRIKRSRWMLRTNSSTCGSTPTYGRSRFSADTAYFIRHGVRGDFAVWDSPTAELLLRRFGFTRAI